MIGMAIQILEHRRQSLERATADPSPSLGMTTSMFEGDSLRFCLAGNQVFFRFRHSVRSSAIAGGFLSAERLEGAMDE